MIGFAGLSHLGIVSTVAAASKGFDVLAYDPDPALGTELAAGRLPIHEPGLPEALASCRDRIRFTADPRELRECDVNYLSLDVPTGTDNGSDVATLDERFADLAANSAPGTALVLLSQAPPGTTRRWAQRLTGAELAVYYQAETLVFGRAVERALRPERIVIGCHSPERDLPGPYADLLAAFACPIFRMRYESAELTKIAINMYLVSSVSVTNTLAALSEKLGADWAEIVPTLRLDPRIGPHAYLTPGLGLSGGNLERDLATVRKLAGEVGTDSGIVDAWLAVSRHRRDWALRVLHAEVLSQLDQPAVAVWGLAYKPDTASTKNSPALALVDALEGVPVRAYDPSALLTDAKRKLVKQVPTPLEACSAADALVVMTPWPEFAAVPGAALRDTMRGRTIIDPFGILDGPSCRLQGFDYFRLGTSLAPKEVIA